MQRRVFTLPGIDDSSANHWQSHWEKNYPQVMRIQQADWHAPVCDEWVDSIERAVERETALPILAAHSLGCLAAAHWAARTRLRCYALLLVAVPDPHKAGFPPSASGFAPLPPSPNVARSVIVGSENDPYADPAFARALARTWNASYISVGNAGHLNDSSGLGEWREGWAIVEGWRRCLPDPEGA